jgi:hypothetical protein
MDKSPCHQGRIYTTDTQEKCRDTNSFEKSEKWKRLSVDKIFQHILELPNTEFNYNSFGIIEDAAHF